MVNTSVLYELSSNDTELDMQAIECFLTSVKPTIQSSSDGKWSAEANDRFKQLTMSKYLMIQVRQKAEIRYPNLPAVRVYRAYSVMGHCELVYRAYSVVPQCAL